VVSSENRTPPTGAPKLTAGPVNQRIEWRYQNSATNGIQMMKLKSTSNKLEQKSQLNRTNSTTGSQHLNLQAFVLQK
jgi:hypothetical protein